MTSRGESGTPDRGAEQGNVHRKRAERRPEIVKRRREQRQREFEKQRRNWLILRVVSALVIAGLLLGAGWWGFRQWEEYQVSQDVTEYFGTEDHREHVEGEVLYEQVPPVGGPHNSAWQNCGYYSEPVYNWHGVHALEHGAVWVTYDPDLPQEDIDKLEDLANQSYVLVSPYPGLEHPVVASVWGKQLPLDGVDDDRLEPFLREYRMNPNNTPEPGALCSLGVDFTMEDGESPQTVPAIIFGSPEEVAAAEATATAEAGGTPEGAASTPPAAAGSPAVTEATPAATPAGTPMASPAASPAATPE